MKPMWNTQPYASMTMIASVCHGRRPEISHTRANAPQMKIQHHQRDDDMFRSPGAHRAHQPAQHDVEQQFVHCGTIAIPAAFPSPINIDSQAL